MSNKKFITVALFLCATSLVACGGGGGGGGSVPSTGGGGGGGGGGPTATPATPGPTPTPTLAPGVPVTLPASNPVKASTISVLSNPNALAVSLDGNSIGTTPINSSPLGFGTHTIVVTPKVVATPYTVTLTNNGSVPNINVFYNGSSDSFGKIANGIATSSVARATTSTHFADSRTPRRNAQAFAGGPAFADGKVAVQYDTARFGGRTFDAVESAHGIARAQTLYQNGSHVTRVLSVGSGVNVDSAVAGLRGEAGVVSASRVGLRYPAAGYLGTFGANDTYFEWNNNGVNGDQWYMYLIDAADAWGYGQGKAPIAIIDTGFDPKQTDIVNVVSFQETIVGLLAYANTATDHDGHGTYLSGIADAQLNNASGFAGMAFNTPLQEYKIFADGSTSAQTSDEAAAIYAAVANGAKVILLALQSSPANGPDPIEETAVESAIQSGVTVVAASGDDNGTALDYPAGYPGVVSVGASIVNDTVTPGTVTGQGNVEQVAAYSNAGTGLGMVAPGGQGTGADSDILHWVENLYTTQPGAGLPACAAGTAPSDCKILFTGTSPAAALVAGTASLMLTVNPALTPAQVANELYSSADDIKDPKEGHGRLNAQRAVAFAAGDPTPQPAYPLPRAIQFVAFAYANSGATLPVAPQILDSAYPNGVPVNADGTFRISDVNPATLTAIKAGLTTYKIGIWFSRIGDGKVHPGDWFTAPAGNCSINSTCTASINNLTASQLAANATKLP